MSKYLLGFVVGVLCVLIALVGYTKICLANQLIRIEQKTNCMLKDSAQENIQASINDFNIKLVSGDEKIASLHKRFDDLYVLGGTIVVLLIAINIGIYVRTEDEVERYFTENFEVHNKKILNFLEQSADAVAKIDANLAVSQNKQDTTTETTEPPVAK
jgi:hypothetical protein